MKSIPTPSLRNQGFRDMRAYFLTRRTRYNRLRWALGAVALPLLAWYQPLACLPAAALLVYADRQYLHARTFTWMLEYTDPVHRPTPWSHEER